MKKVLIRIGETIYALVFAVGCFSIYEFASARQPMATKVILILLTTAAACGFLWMAFFRPLIDTLKTEPNQSPEPTPTTVTPPAGQEARQP